MASHGVQLLLTATKTVTLVFGGVLTYFSYKAFRRTGSGSLRTLTIGIGLLTIGALLGGGLHQVGGIPLVYSISVQSIFTAIGFATMTYSLFSGVSSISGRITSDAESSD